MQNPFRLTRPRPRKTTSRETTQVDSQARAQKQDLATIVVTSAISSLNAPMSIGKLMVEGSFPRTRAKIQRAKIQRPPTRNLYYLKNGKLFRRQAVRRPFRRTSCIARPVMYRTFCILALPKFRYLLSVTYHLTQITPHSLTRRERRLCRHPTSSPGSPPHLVHETDGITEASSASAVVSRFPNDVALLLCGLQPNRRAPI
jgi:hypothetical protein